MGSAARRRSKGKRGTDVGTVKQAGRATGQEVSALLRLAVVARVAFRLVERNNRDWPEDDGALLDLDLEESLFAQS